MSGSVMIFMASLVVFGEYGFFLGPLLVGLCCGLFDVVHLRNREWAKIAFNAAVRRLSLMLARIAVFWLIASPASDRQPFVLARNGIGACGFHLPVQRTRS